MLLEVETSKLLINTWMLERMLMRRIRVFSGKTLLLCIMRL